MVKYLELILLLCYLCLNKTIKHMKQLTTILKFLFVITIFNPFFLAGLFDFIKYGNYGFIFFACLISLLCTSMILLLSGSKFFTTK